METDTIAAIATAMTNSGIGIVRISGSEAIQVADRVFEGKKSEKHLTKNGVRRWLFIPTTRRRILFNVYSKPFLLSSLQHSPSAGYGCYP